MAKDTRKQRYYESGAFQLAYTNALQHFSREHAHPFGVIAELVDNGRDAGARTVFIEVTRESITVCDDGMGMIPWIREPDHETFQRFITEIEQGQEPVDIRSVIDPISMKSLEWLAVNAAFSGKQYIDSTQRGEKGVGVQSARSLGDTVVIRTRPSRQLALTYWGEGDYVESPPVCEYFAPTKQQLLQYKASPTIRIGEGPLVDPFKHELVQGTQVVITDVKDGVLQSLRPGLLLEQLYVRFGNDVSSGMKIAVIDNLTDEGRRKGGLTQYVKAASYRGTLVYSGDLILRGGSIRCRAEIYYTPMKSASGVAIRRKGSDVAEIKVLPEFREQPFTSVNVIGYIEYPDVKEAEWDSKKTEPLMGPLRKEWTNVVKSIIPEIREKIDALESRSKNAKLSEVSKRVGEAIVEALSQMEDFNPLTVQGGRRQRQKPEREGAKRNPDAVEHRLLVRVEDEHRRPIPDVEVICRAPGETMRKTTKTSGQVSFGKDLWKEYPSGKFRIEVIVPEGMESMDGLTEEQVLLTSSVPGRRLIFKLKTGIPGPKPLNIREIFITLTQNLGVIYSAGDLPYSGIILIDQDMGEYGEAARTHNLDRIAELTALYVACAVVEISYNHEQPYPMPPQFQLMKAAELASMAMRVYREQIGSKRK